MNVRWVAARIVDKVTSGKSLSDSLDFDLTSIKDSRDRALVQAICYGVCRFYFRLDFILSLLLKKPMNAKDSDVHALLLVGLYQLMAMRVPAHAAVSETVSASGKLKKPWARAFINAILREYIRKKDEIDEKIKEDEEAYFAHPLWLIDPIKESYPENWQEILEANNTHPPLALRVNPTKTTRNDYIDTLTKNNFQAQSIPETQNGIILESPISVDELPDFSKGFVSVQDGAAQLAAELLELESGQHVLDACAAPGGKLTHLLELQPNATAVAVEKDADRIHSIKENLARLKVNAEVICSDASDVKAWWDGKLFDRILLDAPCSASGVIRRHPDIKLLRQPEDIPAFAEEQLHLLESLWPLLKHNGILVYVTCSIFPEENEDVLKVFLAENPDAEEIKINADWGMPLEIGRQILPGQHQMDGFYYAKLRKMSG